MDYSISEIVLINFLAIAGSIFSFAIVLHAFSTLGCNQNPVKWKKSVAILLCFLITLVISLLNSNLLNLLSFTIFLTGLGYFFYNRQKSHLIYYLLLCIGVCIADCIAYGSFSFLLQSGTVSYHQEFYYLVLYIVYIRLLEFIAVTVLSNVFVRKLVGNTQWIPFLFTLLFPLFSLFFIYSLIYLLQVYPGTVQLILFLINTILLFGLNLFFSYVFETFLKNTQLKQDLQLSKQHAELQYRYYEKLEAQYQESRKVIHDIRNHIQSVERLADLNEFSSVRQYTTDMQDMLNQLGMTYYTSNKVLNIILNDKVPEMNALAIKPEIMIRDISLSYLKDIDITTIFSNLLDNAIEASAHSKEKWISFRAEKKNDFTSIVIQNTFLYTPMTRNHRFISTKDTHHGLGLTNVEQTLKNYNSDIQYEITDELDKKIFTVRLLLNPI